MVRPYTPISTNALTGSFDLLVKDYGPDAKLSHELCTRMAEGDTIDFFHIGAANVKLQAPFAADEICMLVGGTGVTPMIQALHAILGDPDCKTPVTMLYGSRGSDDILGSDVLHQWATDHADQFTLVDILSDEPKDSDWTGRRGYIDEPAMKEYCSAPDTDKTLLIFVCGPPNMYNALCGPREEADKVDGVLGRMGFNAAQVYKF